MATPLPLGVSGFARRVWVHHSRSRRDWKTHYDKRGYEQMGEAIISPTHRHMAVQSWVENENVGSSGLVTRESRRPSWPEPGLRTWPALPSVTSSVQMRINHRQSSIGPTGECRWLSSWRFSGQGFGPAHHALFRCQPCRKFVAAHNRGRIAEASQYLSPPVAWCGKGGASCRTRVSMRAAGPRRGSVVTREA